METQILCIVGPTASGKSARAVDEARKRGGSDGAPFGGEIISVDSRQVYRGLDIGTEKIHPDEMQGVPHHLIDIREPEDSYSAGDFVADATRLVGEITSRGKLPILVGGTHFYFDALLYGLPAEVETNVALRDELETLSTPELYEQVCAQDPRRARELDPHNRRRLIRALEIITALGAVPPRYPQHDATTSYRGYRVEWIVIDPPREELRARIDARLASALDRGLVEEVRRVRERVGDERLNELGLEYKIVGEYLSSSAKAMEDKAWIKEKLIPILSSKLWQYARRQKAWLRKLGHGN